MPKGKGGGRKRRNSSSRGNKRVVRAVVKTRRKYIYGERTNRQTDRQTWGTQNAGRQPSWRRERLHRKRLHAVGQRV